MNKRTSTNGPEDKKTNDEAQGFSQTDYIEEGRGLGSIEDCVDASVQQLKDYITKSKGILNTVIRNSSENINQQNNNT